jgi:hypothetical protein
MARRIGGQRLIIPGVGAALIAHWRRFDARFVGQRFGEWADIIERGEVMNVGYESIFCALVRAGFDRELRHLDPGARYDVVGDVLTIET